MCCQNESQFDYSLAAKRLESITKPQGVLQSSLRFQIHKNTINQSRSCKSSGKKTCW